MIKPMPLPAAVPGGFTQDDFTVNDDNRMTCPSGHTRPISGGRRVTFGAVCRGCPMRAACTTNPPRAQDHPPRTRTVAPSSPPTSRNRRMGTTGAALLAAPSTSAAHPQIRTDNASEAPMTIRSLIMMWSLCWASSPVRPTRRLSERPEPPKVSIGNQSTRAETGSDPEAFP